MNKLIYLGIVSITIMIACRKETPLELYPGLEETSATCQNGVMDGNEDGIDCGTLTCTPCNLSHSISCSNESFTDNQIYVTLSGGTTTDFESAEVTSSTASGKLVITATKGNKTLRATFSSATPQVFRGYECVDDSTPDSESVYLQYVTGIYTYSAYTSDVHLNREGGKYTIEFCNAYMSTPSVGGFMIAKGRLISSN